MGSLFLLSGCDQGQKKEATEANVKKDIYLQLYSVRDDIKANYQATIDTVANFRLYRVEAAGYNDGQFYGMAPADFKNPLKMPGWKFFLPTQDVRWLIIQKIPLGRSLEMVGYRYPGS